MMCCNENSPLYFKKNNFENESKREKNISFTLGQSRSVGTQGCLPGMNAQELILYFYTFIKHFPLLHMSIICYFYSKIREKETPLHQEGSRAQEPLFLTTLFYFEKRTTFPLFFSSYG